MYFNYATLTPVNLSNKTPCAEAGPLLLSHCDGISGIATVSPGSGDFKKYDFRELLNIRYI
jgi:hypothetical protein